MSLSWTLAAMASLEPSLRRSIDEGVEQLDC